MSGVYSALMSPVAELGHDLRRGADVFGRDVVAAVPTMRDTFTRALKYLLEGLAVAFVAYYFTNGLSVRDVLMLGITAALVFAILDTFAPAVALGSRLGAGLTLGSSLVGAAGAPVAASALMMA